MTPVIIAEAEVIPARGASEPGIIDENLDISTGLDRLRIKQLKPSGKRLMSWKDFVNGHRVVPGDRFARVEGGNNA
jgi:methionyl-tRNA formyltransferase